MAKTLQQLADYIQTEPDIRALINETVRYLQAAWPPDGSTEVTVLSRKTTLTDAQIKTLPTTPFELVEAPGSGKKIIPNYGYAVFKTSNGAYTNLGFDGANGVLGFFIRGFSVMPYAAVANALNGAGGEVSLVPRYRMFEAGDPEIGDSNARAGEPKSIDWPLENAALTLSVDNYTDEYALDLGNFTGGHADNTLEITVFYSIVDL